jgi:zinc protease
VTATPLPGTPRAYHFPSFERQAAPGGATTIVASLNKLPLVTCAVVFPHAGASSEESERAGIAQLTAAMILEGTQVLGGAALAEAFESLGSSLSIDADWDCLTATFTVQPARLTAAIQLLRDVLRAPAFREADLARIKGDHESARVQFAADPRALGDAALAWRCYQAAGSRFRRPLDGTLATVHALSREDLAAFWATHGSTDNVSVIFAGDISVSDAMSASELLLEGWGSNRPPPAMPALPVVEPVAGALTLVERAEAAQCELRVGHVGVPRAHPEYYALTVMNAVLGGLFSSRINLNLRERHGYTYGAFSGFDWRVNAGPWAVSTAVKTEVTRLAINEVLAEIRHIREEPISTGELELATRYLVGVFPLRFETTAAVASAIASLSVYGLAQDYFNTYRERIAAVTPSDVLDVARAHLHPDALHVVAVGEPNALRDELAAIGTPEFTTPAEVEAAK